MGRHGRATRRHKPEPWAWTEALVADEWKPTLRGLCFACPGWEGRGPRLHAPVPRRATDQWSNVSWSTPTRFGPRVDVLSSSGLLGWADHPSVRRPSAAVTVIWFGETDGNGAAWGGYVIKMQTTDDAFSYGFGNWDSSGNLWGGVGTTSGDLTIQATRIDNVPCMFALRWDGLNGEVSITRLDTFSVNSATGSIGGTILHNTERLCVGHLGTASFTRGLYLDAAYVWDRWLEDVELERLLGDPYGPFRPARRRVTVATSIPVGQTVETDLAQGLFVDAGVPFLPLFRRRQNTLLRM